MTPLKKLLTITMPKSRFIRGVGMLAGGSVLAQGLTVLVSPLLTRLYSPEEFGLFAVYVSILSILVVPASLCYELAIPLPEDDNRAANLLVLSLSINLVFSGLIAIIVWIWHNSIAELVKIPELSHVLWLLPIGFLGVGIFQSLNYWIIRKQAYIRILQTKWKQSLAMVLVQVCGGFIHIGSLGLVAGDLAGKMAGTGSLAIASWKEDKEVFKRVSLREMKQVSYRYRRFPLLSSWSSVLNSLGLQIPVLFLTATQSVTVVGWYALAFRVLGLPLNIISSAVGQVHMSESARLIIESPGQMRKLFWKTIRTMLMIGFPVVGILALLAPWLFSFVFGQEWREAGLYLQIFCPMFLLDLVANSIGGSITVLERQDLHAIRETTRLILMCLVVIVASFFSFSPLVSMISLSIAGSMGYLIHVLLSWIAIRKYQRLVQN